MGNQPPDALLFTVHVISLSVIFKRHSVVDQITEVDGLRLVAPDLLCVVAGP